MKKIGLVTFFQGNFGSILQCYATKCAIEKEGFECEILFQTDNISIKNVSWISPKLNNAIRLIMVQLSRQKSEIFIMN